MDLDYLQLVVVVLLGGLLGWFLGRLPEHYVYVIAIIVCVLALVVLRPGG